MPCKAMSRSVLCLVACILTFASEFIYVLNIRTFPLLFLSRCVSSYNVRNILFFKLLLLLSTVLLLIVVFWRERHMDAYYQSLYILFDIMRLMYIFTARQRFALTGADKRPLAEENG